MQRLIPTCGINNGSGSLKKTKTFVELLRTEAAFEAWLKFSCPPRRLDGGVWKGSLWHLINPAAWSCTGLWDWEWANESVLRVFMLVCLTLSPWENTKGGGGKTLSSCHISCSDRSGVKLISVFTPDWTDPVMGHYTSCVVRISWCYVWEILQQTQYNTDGCLLGFSSLACSLKETK